MTNSRLIESWTWYGVTVVIFVLRYISRGIRLASWKKWELDDYVMLLAFGFYTNFLVFVNIQEKYPDTNILPSTGTTGMSQAEVNNRIHGSKVTFVLEESMIMTQFLCKACMCLFLYKLTDGLASSQKLVRFAFAYVILGWLTTEIFFFAIWCRPFADYFRVFDSNSQSCTTAHNHLVMSYTFNISSDLIILLVPIPMIVRSKLPWKRKAVIMGIFSFGIFVIIAATLSRYYTFAKPDSILWIFWYVREASTVVMVANIPHLYALLRQIFHLGAFGNLVQRTKTTFSYGRRTNDSGKSGPEQTDHSAVISARKVKIRSESTEDIITQESGLALEAWPLKNSEHNARTAYEAAADDEWMGGASQTGGSGTWSKHSVHVTSVADGSTT